MINEWVERVRQSKDDMEVRHGQKTGALLEQPLICAGALTARAMPVTATVRLEVLGPTIRATVKMATQLRSVTTQQCVKRLPVMSRQTMASGNVALSVQARAIREIDAERWALFEKVEKEYAGKCEATKEAAHRAAGTFGVMMRIILAGLEAEGEIYRTGEMRDGSPVFAAREHYRH